MQSIQEKVRYARRFILTAIGLSLILTVVGCMAFIQEVNHLLTVLQKHEATESKANILRDCLEDLQDMETGQRGYLLTGKAEYLRPYFHGKERLHEDLQELKNQIGNAIPNEALLTKTLVELASAKDEELFKTIELYRNGKADEAIAVVNLDQGMNSMDAIRATIGQYVDGYNKQLSTMKTQVDRHLSTAKSLFVFWIFGLISLVAAAFWNAHNSHRLLQSISRQFQNESMHDPLTGLPNRRYLNEWLRSAMANGARSGQKVAVLYIDLDGFSEINNRFGHVAGDAALLQATKVFKQHLRESDFIARLGGDEFIIICSNYDLHQLAQFAQRLNQILQSHPPNETLPKGILGASIGIAIAPDHATNIDELIRKADEAMYQAKTEGRRCFRFSAG